MKIGQDKFYKYYDLWWSFDITMIDLLQVVDESYIEGPYCLKCYSDLLIPESALSHSEVTESPKFKANLICSVCNKVHVIHESIPLIKHFVAREYVKKIRSQIPKESLEDVPSDIKVRDQDDKYFLAAKIGKKDGRRVGVVYFGEKNKDQSKNDYSQIFIDLDDGQVRFDKSNKNPKDILAKMIVEFPDTTLEEKYTKK